MTRHNLKPATIMDDDLLAPQDFLDLQVLWYLYQFSPDYVLGEYNASHRDEGLISLFEQNGQYSVADLTYVVDAQSSQMANVLPMYSELAGTGQVELTTTPYYHPIMPLLMMTLKLFDPVFYVFICSHSGCVASVSFVPSVNECLVGGFPLNQTFGEQFVPVI